MRRASLILLLAAGCSAAEGQNGEEPPAEAELQSATARRVEVATVEPSPGRLELSLPGEVEGSHDALLAASMGGYVERVLVDSGDEVRSGQVLARVDAASHAARLRQARVEKEAAERELDRARRLGDAIPSAQLDQAETRHAAAVAALRTAQVAVSRAIVKAPFAGTVADVAVEQGEVAAPGAPLVRLIDLDPVHVVATVPDRDVVALREGMEVRVQTQARAAWHDGTLIRINPAADTRTRSFTVEVEVPNPGHELLPGMIATVSVDASVDGEELIVPQDWVVTRREGLGVFVVTDGSARWKPVELGRVIHDQVVVRSGIESGDHVVVTGQRSLAEGDEVIVTRSGTCCTDGRVVFAR